MISLIPLLVLLIGLILYYRPSPPSRPQTSAVGLNMFWVGLLVFLVQLPTLMLWLGDLTVRHR